MYLFYIKISKVTIIVFILLIISFISSRAQNQFSISGINDSLPNSKSEAIAINKALTPKDSLQLSQLSSSESKTKRNWDTWRPNPKRALWLAIVLPGAGQVYNRKYWKLPLIYGGFVGCIYALQWNNTMFKDYSQAYLDIMDSDPSTESYNQFLHLGTKITSSNITQYQDIFRRRKDRYRRWRDLSFFCMLGVYALSIIDAYVDASLSEFDISDKLSLRIEPTVFSTAQRNSLNSPSAIGLHGCLIF
ncbi:hypothetical protein HMPREF9151_01697 [Hoylesella saccharolytica F0055]|uniref:DUF5683 domain-containing protein n=1 Tax=Hoylesella saccharolytica F0055 TaxID=1127699 RepID=L1N841_9BACT|nr:hypothetical protein HMPREF9151_01697 [Hoylesella saccharolytica F0055]